MNIKLPHLTRRSRNLIAVALTACAALAGGAGAAQAQVPDLPANTPFKLKFAHSGQILNVPNASHQEDVPLIQYHDIGGFPNDNFTFTKVGGSFGPNSYVINAGKDQFNKQLYVMPRSGQSGQPVVQDRGVGPFAVWDLKPSHLPGHVHIVHRNSGNADLAMNVTNASTSAGAGVILWPAQSQFLNDDIKILPAT